MYNIEDLTNFDYIILFLILTSTILAFVKGFIKSIISLFGWVLITLGMYGITPFISPFIKNLTANPILKNLFAILLSFILTLIVSSVITGKLHDWTKNIRGGVLDRFLGVIFGIARGALFSSIIVMFISLLWQVFVHKEDSDNNIIAPDWLKQAKTYDILNRTNKMLTSYLPSNIQNELNQIGNYKDLSKLIDRQQIIQEILNSLPKDVLSNLTQEYIDKLKDPKTSIEEQNKIMDLILKLNKNSSDNLDSNKLIKQLLDQNHSKNSTSNKNDEIIKRLIEK